MTKTDNASFEPATGAAPTGRQGAATGLPAKARHGPAGGRHGPPLPPAKGKAPTGRHGGRQGPQRACPCLPLPCLCSHAAALCRAAATAQPLGAAATTNGYERFSVSVTMPGGITGTLSTSYLPGKRLGITMGVIADRIIHCSKKETK